MYLIRPFLCCLIFKSFVETEIITLVKKDNIICVMTNEDVTSPVYIHPPTLVHSKSNDITKCLQSPWTHKSENLGILLDERWEDFETLSGELKIKLKPQFEYGFSYCGITDIKIDENRKYKNETNTPDVSATVFATWNHYTIKCIKKNKTYLVEIFQDKKIIVRKTVNGRKIRLTSESPSFWKLHNVSFVETNFASGVRVPEPYSGTYSTVSFFLKIQQNKTINITLNSNSVSKKKTVTSNSEQWQKIEFNITSKSNVNLTFSGYSNTTLGISSVKLSPTKTRLYHAYLPNRQSENGNYSCKLLQEKQKKVIKLKQCKKGNLGSYCNITCESILGNNYTFCENYTICNDGGCVNSWNYTEICYNQEPTKDPIKKLAILALITTSSITFLLLVYLCFAYKFGIYPFDLRFFKAQPLQKARVSNTSKQDIVDFSQHYRMTSIKSIRPKPDIPTEEIELKQSLIEPQIAVKQEDDNFEKISVPINIKEFENYLLESIGDDPYNNSLTKQYKKLQKNINKPCTVGLSKKNNEKNRYKNLAAFDETRVILKSDSDYINANYVQGYENQKAFIAAQAPLKSTVNDFWLMIWQENVDHIFMLTQLEENGSIKCAQYWPVLEHETIYGKIMVKNKLEKVFSDFVLRQFTVNCKGVTRLINHFQYTTWPDHGVPLYPQNFTPFVKMLLALPQQNSPILVHCNAGCGRTGTLILCDIILRMAAKEKKIDFPRTLLKLKEQRAGLVNNVNQYVFAHFLVKECLFGKNFSIPVDDNFQNEIFKVLRKTTIKPVMDHLDEVMIFFKKQQVKFSSSLSVEERAKNRFSDILPGHTQIYLPIDSESTSSYINAVSVDCYRCPKKFIVTQQPLPNTLEDFWKLIKEFEINTIVSLNEIEEDDPNCPQFWLCVDESTVIETIDESEQRVYTKTKLRVTDKKSKINKIVNILRMKNWQRTAPYPPSPKDLIILWKGMFNDSWKGNSQIVVTCYDGVLASGIFVALAYLLEKINYEQICDVFSAIRTVRQSREQFVQQWGQIELLYKAAKVYIEDFDNYDNFQLN